MFVISATDILMFVFIYATVTIIAITKVFKNETKISLFLWMALILIFPAVGGILYLLYNFVSSKKVSIQ